MLDSNLAGAIFILLAILVRASATEQMVFLTKNWQQATSASQAPDSAKLKAAVADAPKLWRRSVDYLECTIAPSEPSRAPKPLRQGESLSPQSVSALAISPDGRQIAVTTMAFRHDRNFWLLSRNAK